MRRSPLRRRGRIVDATWGTAFALAIVWAGASPRAQSLSYSSGQPVAPAYEGWEEHVDGSRWFVFGYMNRNWEEEIDVPIGPDNGFSPVAVDQGQPTHFLPRRNRFIFRIPVPEGFTERDEMVWTLTTHGKTEKAFASLKTDYKMDDMIIASESGALGAGSSSPEVRANKAPQVQVQGPARLTAKVGETLTVVVLVTDDGIPKVPKSGRAGAAVENEGSSQIRASSGSTATDETESFEKWMKQALMPPARVTVGKHVGLHVSWFVYRGAGHVAFHPEQVTPWEDTRTGANSPWAPSWQPPPMPADGKVPVEITFDAPGEYVLWARADDGALTTDTSISVLVSR